MPLRALPALIFCGLASPILAQAVSSEQLMGTLEGAEGETLVVAAGVSDTVYRTYRIFNLGDGTVSVGAGESFVDLTSGNVLDFMVSDAALQVTFQDASELEYQLVAIAQ